MMDHKEAYIYEGYMKRMEGAKIKVIPSWNHNIDPVRTVYAPSVMAQSFVSSVKESEDKDSFDDFFNQKTELAEDKVNLVMGEITGRERLRYNNLKSLYENLMRINNWRLTRPFPEYYQRDRVWSDLNKMEIQIRNQVIRECRDAYKDTSFPLKDLRESLIEFKLADHKSKVLDMSDLERGLTEVNIGPDGSYQFSGDMNSKKTIY